MPITLNWTDTNDNEDGHRVYRSTSTIDPAALPTPLADLGADVTTYTDGDVTEGETYYYRVSAYRGTSENVSEELAIQALPEADAYVASVGAYSHVPDDVETRLIQVPPEAGVGDLLVAFVGLDYSISVLLEPPTGWVRDAYILGDGQLAAFSKIAESSDLGSSVGFPAGASYDSAGIMLALRGASGLAVLDDASSNSNSYPSWDMPSLTLPQGDALVLSACFVEGLTTTDTTFTVSQGWTLASPASTDGITTLAVAWQKYTSPSTAQGEFDNTDVSSTDKENLMLAVGRAP